MRRYALSLVAAVLVVGVIEIAAWMVLRADLVSHRAVRIDLDAFGAAPTVAQIDAFRRYAWDPELGWRRRPGASDVRESPSGRQWRYTVDARGARANPFEGRGGELSVYGDSFTFGDEVDDDETWPYRLSQRMDTAVDNWGHSGWAPDQALLLFRQNLPTYRTRIVVLAVQTGNIARLANSYRPFLTKAPSMKLAFKPLLVWRDDRLVWQPNPLDRLTGPRDFARAFVQARATDYWYAFNEGLWEARFPFSVALTGALWCQVRACFHPDLYADPRMTARLDVIAEEFYALAEEQGFVPVLLFLPEPRVLRHFARHGDAGYRRYVRQLRGRVDLPGLRIIDLLDHEFELRRFNWRPFKDHPSPYGHRVIADTLYRALLEIREP